MSDSAQIHRRQPTRLPRPWDSPGKNTGVGCHFLLQFMKVKSESEVVQLCPTLSDPMDCSLPGSSIHGIFQARVLEWGAIAFSGSSSYWPSNYLFPEILCGCARCLEFIPGWLGTKKSPGWNYPQPCLKLLDSLLNDTEWNLIIRIIQLVLSNWCSTLRIIFFPSWLAFATLHIEMHLLFHSTFPFYCVFLMLPLQHQLKAVAQWTLDTLGNVPYH